MGPEGGGKAGQSFGHSRFARSGLSIIGKGKEKTRVLGGMRGAGKRRELELLRNFGRGKMHKTWG